MSVRDGVASRLLLVEDSPVLVRAWEAGRGRISLRAEPVDPGAVAIPPPAIERLRPAGPAQLALGVERMRFALGVDDDLTEFYRRFRRDPLLGPAIRRRPWLRPRRRPWPWEALAWAVVKQLIETGRAARIQRRMVGRWGARLGAERAPAQGRSLGAADRRTGAGRTRGDRPLAETLDRPCRGRPPDRRRPGPARRARRRPEAAGGSGDRPLDRPVPGALRPRRTRFAPRRRPHLPEAGRPPGAAGPAGDGRGGRGVLRALRAVPGLAGHWTIGACSRMRDRTAPCTFAPAQAEKPADPSIRTVMAAAAVTEARPGPKRRSAEFIDQLSSGGEDYRRLVERLPAIIYTAEMGEHGRWRYVSPQVEKILGYSPEEWIAESRAVGEAAAPRRSRARSRAGDPQDARHPQPAAGRLPDDHPRRRDGLDPRRGRARGGRGRHPGLARRPLRHHRAQDRRAGAEARRGPAGDGRPARRDGPPRRRLRAADGGGGHADDRDRRRRQRLRLGGRARRPQAPPARRPRGPAGRRRQARLGGPRLPCRRRDRVRPARDRRRLVEREPLLDAALAAGARHPQQPRGRDQGQGRALRRPRRPLDRAEPLHAAGRPLRPGLGERPRRRDRAPRRRRGAAAPRPPRLADRAPQPAQLRRLAGGSPQAGVGLRHARSGSSSSTSTTSS